MNVQKLIGNRLVIQRLMAGPNGETAIQVPFFVQEKIREDEASFHAIVVELGTGKELAEKQPEIQVGSRVIIKNFMGPLKIGDSREIISALDVIAVVEDVSEVNMSSN